MQTPGEKYLINFLARKIKELGEKTNIINIGANTSLVIERELDKANCNFSEDRADVIDPKVEYSKLNNSYVCSVEDMSIIRDNTYDIAFANFVLEHVFDLESSAKEINRILKEKGSFVTSIPNPEAPEFIISRFTPHWFHQWVRGEGEGHEAHETKYSYKNIKEFIKIFEERGFRLIEENYTPFTYGYLYRFPLLNILSKTYDYLITKLGVKRFMGNICLVFEKK